MQTTAANTEIEIRADFAQASSLIQFRNVGDDDEGWRATVFQVADARHNVSKALELVNHWLDMQS